MTITFFTVGAILLGITLSVMAYHFLTSLGEKDRFKEAMMRARGDLQIDERKNILQLSFGKRVILPFFKDFLIGTIAKAPPNYVDNVRKKLIKSGKPRKEEVDKFLTTKVLLIFFVPFWFLVIIVFDSLNRLLSLIGGGGDGSLPGFLPWAMFVLGAIVLIFGPDLNLKNKVEKRQTEIVDQLPDVLDLLTISVEAGLGFEQAVNRISQQVQGPLPEELARMIGETRSGSSRADALRALDARIDLPEVRSFIMAILQSDRFGISIGQIIRAQAEESRMRKRQAAEEKAQKAAIKMLAPMLLLIFPVLFIVILGPAAVQIVTGL